MPLGALQPRFPWVRKALGDQRLLPFLRGHPSLFEVYADDEGRMTSAEEAAWKVRVLHRRLQASDICDVECRKAQEALVDKVHQVCARSCKEMQLSWLTSDSRIKKRLAACTRAGGLCGDAEVYSSQWWDVAAELLLRCLVDDARFVTREPAEDAEAADGDGGGGDRRRATLVCLAAPLADDASPSAPPGASVSDVAAAALLRRVEYLIRQETRVVRAKGKALRPELSAGKLGTDPVVENLLEGRKLLETLKELSGVDLRYRGEGTKRTCWVGLTEPPSEAAADDGDACSVGSGGGASTVADAPPPPPPAVVVLLHVPGHVVVVEKPSGVTTEDLHEAACGDPRAFFTDERVGTVSRLDRVTSGALVFPTSKAAELHVGNQFREGTTQKEYLALVCGVAEPAGVVCAKLKLVDTGKTYKTFVNAAGKPAETRYERVAVYRRGNGRAYSLLRVRPVTGRTHQIRAHLGHIGHFLVSDGRYAGEKRAKGHREWCPRLFLHAERITFSPTASGPEVTAVASLPADLRAVLEGLSLDTSEDSKPCDGGGVQ